MVIIRRLWLWTLTRNQEDAGTPSSRALALTVNVDGIDIVDKNHNTSDRAGKAFISEEFAPDP
jgi:hypothetical protein